MTFDALLWRDLCVKRASSEGRDAPAPRQWPIVVEQNQLTTNNPMTESTTSYPSTAYEQHEEDSRMHMVERQANKVPVDIFLWAAAGSIIGSLALKAAGDDKTSLFVGQWAPTLVALGLYSKLSADPHTSRR